MNVRRTRLLLWQDPAKCSLAIRASANERSAVSPGERPRGRTIGRAVDDSRWTWYTHGVHTTPGFPPASHRVTPPDSRVLIVDDDPAICTAYEEILSGEG